MSAFGPKRTCACALHMSAFGGKADITKPCAPSGSSISSCLIVVSKLSSRTATLCRYCRVRNCSLERVATDLAFPKVTHGVLSNVFRPLRHQQLFAALGALAHCVRCPKKHSSSPSVAARFSAQRCGG